ncbi:MAG TPA: NADH:ubiquinone reductase (Na(+)-transporting) subunit C [Saprospiraceae bacterium]|nr:NADH:ubiquinone reductase (Na(+)-transporting) subunit C [Saprospiraceae bacterium]HMP13690.1 NADH:ubiquinone reductase (Na(+)-transporting) subunit C [Saprospiraceae bacterium]
MSTTRYILFFTIAMCVASALLLSGMFYATKPASDRNEVVFNKRAILAAVGIHLGKDLNRMSDQEVLDLFDTQVEQVALNMNGEVLEGVLAEKIDMAKERKKPEADRTLPMFIFTTQDGNKFYILSVRGSGLWDEIWGNIALGEDLNTIAGASFDHKAETPGLGAEIKDNPAFPAQFINKQIYKNGQLVAVNVKKGGIQEPLHQVDAISGATITSNGVTEMLQRGLGYYEPYLQKLRGQGATGMN